MLRTVNLIYAVSLNGVIGHQGQIPWHLPPDLKRFKALTQGSTVVMGRKTWESLPIKPLPGRENIVLSHDMNYSAPGAKVVPHLRSALAQATHPDVWIIGGESVYNEALIYADYAYVTVVQVNVPGDTYAPNCQGKVLEHSVHHHDSPDGQRIDYHFAKIELYNNYVQAAQDRSSPATQAVQSAAE